MTFKYVADTNVLMSILISGKSQYINMLSQFEFYLPEFAFVELNLYKDVVLQRTKLDESQLRKFAYAVFSMVSFVPSFLLQNNCNCKLKTDKLSRIFVKIP